MASYKTACQVDFTASLSELIEIEISRVSISLLFQIGSELKNSLFKASIIS